QHSSARPIYSAGVIALLVSAVLAAHAAPVHAAAPARFSSSVAPLTPALRAEIRQGGYWHQGCPVALSDLRVLRLAYRGFDGARHVGRIVVNANATAPLARAFAQLY